MSESKITLHQFPPIPGVASASPFCLKIHAALNYKGVPFEVKNWMMPWEIKRVSPTSKLPVLDCGDQRIIDSTDILSFIEERYPNKPLMPADPVHRALAALIEDWADESLYFYQMWHRWASRQGASMVGQMLFPNGSGPYRALGSRAATFFVKKNLAAQGLGRKSPEKISAEFHDQFDWLDRLLSHNDWLAGPSVSLADIAVGSQLMGVIPEWLPDEVKALQERPNLWAWRERMVSFFG